MKRSALIFLEPRKLEICEEELPAPSIGQVLVRASVSAISAGSELLAYRGQLPSDLPLDSSISGMTGAPEYPLKYGYAVAGEVVEARPGAQSGWLGRRVFCFHPHESHFWAQPEDLIPVPAGIDLERAALLPNMETAVNFVHDGQPLAGESVVVFGQGVVGLLTTALLARFPLGRLVVLDRFALRRDMGLQLGASAALDPLGPDALAELHHLLDTPDHPGADLVYELSGSPEALDAAISAAGFHGRVVIGSWYGQKPVSLNLGGAFHRGRIRVISSQVSSLNPELSGRWSKARRLDWAWHMLAEIPVTNLLTHRVAFQDAPQIYQLLDEHPESVMQALLVY